MESGWSTHPTQFLPRSLKVNYYKLLFCLILQAIVKKGKSIQSAVILLQKGMVSSGTAEEKSGVPVQNQGVPVQKTMTPKFRASSWSFTWLRSCEIQVNPRNPAKFTKTQKIRQNSVEIISNTCLYNIFETYFSDWGYLLAVNFQINLC